MYLYIQGSEVTFPFPDYSEAARDTISLYSMLTYIPSCFVVLLVTSYFIEAHGKYEQKWYKRFPVAFNLLVNLEEDLGRNYQRFFFFAFFILPAILQIHSLKEFFTTYAYTRDLVDDQHQVIAKNFWEHLTNWQPNPLANDYMFGDPSKKPVTYFPVIEAWLFLILQLGLAYYLIKTLIRIFSKKVAEKPVEIEDENRKGH